MNILLIYGGKSCEHDISIITACLAKGYFRGNIYSCFLDSKNNAYLVPNDLPPKEHKTYKFKYKVAFCPGQKQIALVSRNKIRKVVNLDVVVNCCHGLCGEDGSVAGLCNLCNLPLVGSGIVASAVAMDKSVTKAMLSSLGFPVLPGVTVAASTEDDLKQIEKLGYPIIVKPACLGSSIGITLCHNKKELISALQFGFKYDSALLCEHALTNFFELNCAAIYVNRKVEVSSVARPYTANDILTFQDKYQQHGKFASVSEQIPAQLAAQVENLTVQIYSKLNMSGVVRIDYLVEKQTENIYVNEINSIPGSLSYGLWQDKYSLTQFGNILIQSAMESYNQEQSLIRDFPSGVLDSLSFAKK